jgi:hypothetical protein
MDRSQFDTRADRLRAYAKELQITVEDRVAQATNLISVENPTGLAGASHSEPEASVAPGRICGRLEDVMAAYDRLREASAASPATSKPPGATGGQAGTRGIISGPLGLMFLSHVHEPIARLEPVEQAVALGA